MKVNYANGSCEPKGAVLVTYMVRINLFGGSGLQNIMNPHYDVGSVLVGTITPHKKRIVRCVRDEAGFLLLKTMLSTSCLLYH